MKKIRILVAINIVQIVLLVAAIVTTVILMPNIMLFDNSDSLPAVVIQGTDSDIHNGYTDVTVYGAVADDGKDDTAAFIAAAKTGAGVYVPIGTFDIEKTVNLKGQNLKGAGIDRTIVRFNGKGTIVKISGAALIDDITLTFAEESISGDEAEGEQVAIWDNGLTNGAMLRAVKTVNVGTGYYSPVDATTELAVTIESMIIDKFSHKAIEIKDAYATLFRATHIKEAIGEVDAAVSLGGSFTLETMSFTGTKSQYSLEILNAESAVVKTLLFESTTATSGSFIRSVSSVLSMQTVTAMGSKAQNLIKIEDDGLETIGNVISLYSDAGKLTVDSENRIKCDSNLSQ